MALSLDVGRGGVTIMAPEGSVSVGNGRIVGTAEALVSGRGLDSGCKGSVGVRTIARLGVEEDNGTGTFLTAGVDVGVSPGRTDGLSDIGNAVGDGKSGDVGEGSCVGTSEGGVNVGVGVGDGVGVIVGGGVVTCKTGVLVGDGSKRTGVKVGVSVTVGVLVGVHVGEGVGEGVNVDVGRCVGVAVGGDEGGLETQA